MECRTSLKVREFVLARLTGEPAGDEAAAAAAHLASCASCAAMAAEMESVWSRLADDDGRDLVPSSGFAVRTKTLLAGATRAATNVRPFPAAARGTESALFKIAAVLAAGVLGFFLARGTSGPGPVGVAYKPTPSVRSPENVALVANRTLDASRAALDLSAKPRLSNVSWTPADESGKVAVSFDVTTRYTVVGKPDDQAVASLLVSVVGAGSEGEKGKALDLVSERTRGGGSVSPEIVSLLRRTLETDKNPGVRKKAAEALAQLPPSPDTRDALAAALKKDSNPAVRIIAVEGLAKAAAALKDPSSIETLRQKAADDRENGYVRSQAALALSKIEI